MQTLVLTSAYEPYDIFDLKHAFNKVLTKRAEALSNYVDKKLTTFGDAQSAPSVIRMLYFASLPRNNTRFERLTRKNIYLRDNGICQYCRKGLKPQDQGGVDSWINLVCCCLKCNLRKANRTPAEAGMPLLRKPFAPPRKHSKSEEFLLKLKEIGNLPDKRWMDYIYYDIPLKD
jgi:hypothetical protein